MKPPTAADLSPGDRLGCGTGLTAGAAANGRTSVIPGTTAWRDDPHARWTTDTPPSPHATASFAPMRRRLRSSRSNQTAAHGCASAATASITAPQRGIPPELAVLSNGEPYRPGHPGSRNAPMRVE